MKKLTQTLVLLLLILLVAVPSFSASNGSSPNGKPFIAINDQILVVEGAVTSLQDQIDLLVPRVDTLEGQVVANEEAISTLENQNSALTALVQQNLADISSIESEILLLQQDNENLLSMIAANSGDIATLQSEVSANAAMIASLQSAVLLLQDGIITLESSLQLQIDNNLTLINSITAELALIKEELDLKQNLIAGICPDGSAVKEILADGSFVCENIGVSATLQQFASYAYSPITDAGGYAYFNAVCPAGSVATGGGYSGALNWKVYSLQVGYNFVSLAARNDATSGQQIMAQAMCIKLE